MFIPGFSSKIMLYFRAGLTLASKIASPGLRAHKICASVCRHVHSGILKRRAPGASFSMRVYSFPPFLGGRAFGNTGRTQRYLVGYCEYLSPHFWTHSTEGQTETIHLRVRDCWILLFANPPCACVFLRVPLFAWFDRDAKRKKHKDT